MDFKIGDKVICIDNYGSRYIQARTEYTVAEVSGDNNFEGRIRIAELPDRYQFRPSRFIHAPTTELERLIYGL